MAKTLVAYFSWSETTKRLAEKIAKTVDGDLYRIEPAKPYPKSYGLTAMKGLAEQIRGARPKLKGKIENLKDYDQIVLGMPIWWYNAPAPVCSFLESYDFTGKVIYPFCTHQGSGPSKSDATLRRACKTGTLKDCKDGNGMNDTTIRTWLNN